LASAPSALRGRPPSGFVDASRLARLGGCECRSRAGCRAARGRRRVPRGPGRSRASRWVGRGQKRRAAVRAAVQQIPTTHPSPPSPPHRLPLPPADCDKPGRERHDSRHAFFGRAQPRNANHEPAIRHEHGPAFPRAGQAPSPAVAFSREPVAGWVGCVRFEVNVLRQGHVATGPLPRVERKRGDGQDGHEVAGSLKVACRVLFLRCQRSRPSPTALRLFARRGA